MRRSARAMRRAVRMAAAKVAEIASPATKTGPFKRISVQPGQELDTRSLTGPCRGKHMLSTVCPRTLQHARDCSGSGLQWTMFACMHACMYGHSKC